MVSDSLEQSVQAHKDFFIPLTLSLPKIDVDKLNNGIIKNLKQKHALSDRLWFNTATSTGDPLEDTRQHANKFLDQFNLEAETMGIFIVNANTYDWNIHSDSARLETRLNFYELTTSPGIVRWFPDTTDGYEEIHKNLDGNDFIDYTWPWVVEFKQQHRDWSKIPLPIWSTATSCSSALVRTDLPHHVIQGDGLRITVTCKVVDKTTKSTRNTWERLCNLLAKEE
jgi:hypothetical protein